MYTWICEYMHAQTHARTEVLVPHRGYLCKQIWLWNSHTIRTEIGYRSLLQNIVSFLGLFCKRELQFNRIYFQLKFPYDAYWNGIHWHVLSANRRWHQMTCLFVYNRTCTHTYIHVCIHTYTHAHTSVGATQQEHWGCVHVHVLCTQIFRK